MGHRTKRKDMSNNKRYFWLKLYEDFFTSKRIKKLRNLAGGDTFTIIYLKMQLKALKTNGFLYFDGIMSDFAEELALDIDESVDDVRLTIQYLLSVGLIECSESGEEYFLTYMKNVIGSETASTQRSREFREKKKEEKALQCNTSATHLQQVGNAEKEIDIEKDIDIHIGDFATQNNADEGQNAKANDKQNDNMLFEALWKLYPKKRGKGQISQTQKHKIAKVGLDEMTRAIDRFKESIRGKDMQYVMYGSTFFNSGYVDFLDENYEDIKQTNRNEAVEEWLNK